MKKLLLLVLPIAAAFLLLSHDTTSQTWASDAPAPSTYNDDERVAVQPAPARADDGVPARRSADEIEGALLPRVVSLPLGEPTALPTAPPAVEPPAPTATLKPKATATPARPPITLDSFAATVKTGQRDVVSGVFVPNALALRVDQQPANDPLYISNSKGIATQFGLAAQYGTIGLLAHNHLAGASFASLPLKSELDIVYGDGSVKRYVISGVRRFQAVSPKDATSDMIDLDNGNVRLSSTSTFQQIYMGSPHVVLQTCIAANGEPSWGRLFVIAVPAS